MGGGRMRLFLFRYSKANRSIFLEEDRVKAETERAKAPVDFTTFHNLLYEKKHYLKAIKACIDFKSKYPDIELVPEAEFFSSVPKDIKETSMSKDSAHDLMLKRLNFELHQVVPTSRGQALADEYGIKFFETSAKTNLNAEQVFFSIPQTIRISKPDPDKGSSTVTERSACCGS
ncbi:hypothetical protein IFM89_003179 [Coptis chinensis]|uniref:Uncharacterized protein n=1 Tax=Coptis chinensis TaxID=261450 RepID=A0A835H445_9MAGN|nr:hypothetical protein IFM89_003179 [Coptis chinensis]